MPGRGNGGGKHREKRYCAEYEDIAAREGFAREQLGERLGEGTVGLPHEPIQQKPADKDGADHGSEQHGARPKR